jgi:hypothetical protein
LLHAEPEQITPGLFMIWIILFIIVIVISFILAYRSMKDFKEIPITPNLEYGLFLVKNTALFNLAYLSRIHKFITEQKSIISFERLLKGEESVLVIFGPKNILTSFPELELMELEDFLLPVSSPQNFDDPNKVSVNQTMGFQISSKQDPKKSLIVAPDFLKNLSLGENQRLFWQVVVSGLKEDSNFQVTLRALVNEPNAGTRAELAKKISAHIVEKTELNLSQRDETTSKVFDDFKKRALVPSEVAKFNVTSDELSGLLGLK